MNGDGGALEGVTRAKELAPRRIRLLLVDDDAALLRVLRRWAEEFAEVEVASSGNEAIERIRNGGSYDCVLSDVQMDDGSGIEVATWLRQQKPPLYRRLVLMTGMAHASLAGHESVPRVDKPCALGNLQALLTRIARSDRSVTERCQDSP